MATTVTDDSYSTPLATDLVVGQDLSFQQQGTAAQVTLTGWAGSLNTGPLIGFNEQGIAGNVSPQGIAGTVDFGFIVGGAIPDKAEVGVSGLAGTFSSLPEASWVSRSTASGVIWAHDFSESDNELHYFTRLAGSSTGSNPNRSNLALPLELTSTPFGASRAIVSKGIGTTLAVGVGSVPAQDTEQVWQVTDASDFPDPALTAPYEARISHDGANNLEVVLIKSINYGTNEITLNRWTTSSTPVTGTPGQAISAGARIGRASQGEWVRPFAAFPAGQNGKAADDIGIAKGLVTKARTWTITQNSNAHQEFKEGYIGHRHYWDTTYNPSALYADWTPTVGNTATRTDAFDGDEIYLQFRAYIDSNRLNTPSAKMLFVQNCTASGPGQFFWQVGPQRYDEEPPVPEAGVTYGRLLRAVTNFDDGSAIQGGTLGPTGNMSGGGGFPVSGSIQENYPSCDYPSRVAGGGTGMECWCFPVDKWVTYHLHFKFGRDNSDSIPVTTPTTDINDWPAGSDPTYRTTVSVQVAIEGETEYTTLVDYNSFIWLFGDLKFGWGDYDYNPPGINSIWGTQNLNDYVGAGNVAPGTTSQQILYTQFIASRNPIPVPDSTPTYVSNLNPNQIAELDTVSNGNDTYFNCLVNAGSPWVPTTPVSNNNPTVYTQHVQKADSFSGGIGNPDERICYMHGGGHAASSYNGVIGFDFKGDTQPTGFFLVPGSESPVPSGQNYPKSDGWPSSIHTYDEIGFDSVNRRLVRFGGSSFQTGGGGPDPDHWYLPIDGSGSGNPWVDFGNTFGVLANVKTVVDPTTNKLFYVNSNLATYFLDMNTYTFSGAKTACPSSRTHQTCSFIPESLNAPRGTVIVMGQSVQWQATVDFELETVSAWTAFAPTGDTGFLTDQMLATFWDELLSVLWIFGGRSDASSNGTLNDYYRYDPVTNVSTKVTVTGTMPVQDNDTDGNTYGLNKRFVYIPDWRAVGIVTVYNKPAYIWRLPDS